MPGNSLNESNELERRIRALESRLSRAAALVSSGPTVYDVTISGSLTGTTFTLSYSDLVQNTVLLVLRGRPLKPGYDFTVVGGTLTMLHGAPFTAGEVSAGAASFNNFFVHQAKRGI